MLMDVYAFLFFLIIFFKGADLLIDAMFDPKSDRARSVGRFSALIVAATLSYGANRILDRTQPQQDEPGAIEPDDDPFR